MSDENQSLQAEAIKALVPGGQGDIADIIYGRRDSITQRFGDKQVDEMYELLERIYTPKRHLIKLFGKDKLGEIINMLVRGRWNKRCHATVVRMYKKLALRKGANFNMRGKLMGMLHHDADKAALGVLELLAGATVIEAIYEGIKEFPKNSHMRRLLDKEIEVLVWDSRLPEDCADWLKNECNSYHTGASFSIVEMYNAPLL